MDRAIVAPRKERAVVTNIPLNTIQSALTEGIDRQREEAIRAQRVVRQRRVERAEQVEDSTEFGVASVEDKGEEASQQQKKKQQQFRQLLEEKVELRSVEDAPPEGVDISASPLKARTVVQRPLPPSLDVSA